MHGNVLYYFEGMFSPRHLHRQLHHPKEFAPCLRSASLVHYSQGCAPLQDSLLQVGGSKKSAHYPRFAKVSAVVVESVLSLTLVAVTFQVILLAVVTAVRSMHLRDQEPDIEAGPR